MAAARKNLIIEPNATFQYSLTWKDEKGRPINLTSYTAKMQIRDDAGTVLAELSTANGKIVLGGVTGKITFTMLPDETVDVTWKEGKYDLVLTEADGINKRRLIEGKVTNRPAQTL